MTTSNDIVTSGRVKIGLAAALAGLMVISVGLLVTARAPIAGEPTTRSFRHGAVVTALDVDTGTTLSLDEALKQSGLAVSLPDPMVVGKPVKVALNETVEDPEGRKGLMIRYDSGLTLTVDPGETNLRAKQARPAGFVPFRDGRASTFLQVDVVGRPVLVRRPGVQKNADGDFPMPAMILWNSPGVTYRLTDGTPGVSGVTQPAIGAAGAAAPLSTDPDVRVSRLTDVVQSLLR